MEIKSNFQQIVAIVYAHLKIYIMGHFVKLKYPVTILILCVIMVVSIKELSYKIIVNAIVQIILIEVNIVVNTQLQ